MNVLRGYVFPVVCAGCRRKGAVLCAHCRPGPEAVVAVPCAGLSVRALGAYGGALRSAILRMKGGERDAAAALGALVAARIGDADLVPVPTTACRRRRRGFDQSRLIAQYAARDGTAIRVHAVLAKRRGPAQHGRRRVERVAMRGRFSVRSHAALPPRALLLDDVMTTGATLLDAAATLAAAGVAVHGAVVLARA